MPVSFTSWLLNQPYGSPPTSASYGPEPFFRDALDARRSGYNQTPEAQWPDGYLGTITDRREDKLLQNVQQRQNARSYVRGVHKGEKIDPRDYYWLPEFNPQTGI